jgi:putative peptidoglycan lipid II flippase
VTITLGLINAQAVVGMLFASRLIDPDLAPAAIDKAFRLYMLPQGMFSVAVATILFPTLSRLAARADLNAFRHTVDTGLRQIAFLLVPAALVSIVLAEPIVRLVYQRGAFTEEDVPVVAECLAAFSLGLVFNGWMLMLTRSFYGLQSNWLPTTIALATLTLNAVFDALFYRLGAWGIPLATAVVNVIGAAALLLLLRSRIQLTGLARTGGSVGRIVAAAVVAAAASFVTWYGLDAALGRSLGGQLVSVGGGLIVAVAAYVLACRALAVRELRALLPLLRRAPDPG